MVSAKIAVWPVLRRFRKSRAWFLRNLQPDPVLVEGMMLHLDKNDWSPLWEHGAYEQGTTCLVKRSVKQGQTFIDVGASVGYFTLLASKLVGERGHVYAFEPSPSVARILRRNVEENALKNVTIEQKALSDNNGHVELFEAIPGVYRSTRAGRRVVVDSIALDNYISSADFIKLDVDGHETRTIHGMVQLLRRSNPKIVMEYWPRGMAHLSLEPIDLMGPLNDLGFRFHSINDDGSTVPVSLAELLRWGSQQAATTTRDNFFDSRNLLLDPPSW